MVLTLSEDREGGGVVELLTPTSSDDLQRETSFDPVINQYYKLISVILSTYCIHTSINLPHSNKTGVLSPDVTLYLKIRKCLKYLFVNIY